MVKEMWKDDAPDAAIARAQHSERRVVGPAKCQRGCTLLAAFLPSTSYFVSIADLGLLGGNGESDNVNQVFQPDGRSWPSNSQYAFRFM
jgi:hypothetical protein